MPNTALNHQNESLENRVSPLGSLLPNRVPNDTQIESIPPKSKQKTTKHKKSKKQVKRAFHAKWDLQEIAREILMDDFRGWWKKRADLLKKTAPGEKGPSVAGSEREKWLLSIDDGAAHPTDWFDRKIPRINNCHRAIIRNDVNVLAKPDAKFAHYNGLQSCGSVWNCPTCAAKITESRRHEIVSAHEKWILKGSEGQNACFMMSLTFPHNHDQSLRKCVKWFQKARRLLKQQKALKRRGHYYVGRGYRVEKPVEVFTQILEKYQIVGTVTALEVTHSFVNGWHVHSHDLIFGRAMDAAGLAELEKDLTVAWMYACKRAGVKIPSAKAFEKNAIRISRADTPADYIAKFGVEVYQEKREILDTKWGSSQELTKQHIKSCRLPKHRTPFDFLREIESATDPDARKALKHKYGKLYLEYTRQFKGKRQLFFSKGLRQLLKLGKEKTNQEIMAETDNQAELKGSMKKDQWHKVCAIGWRGVLLEKAMTTEWGALMRAVDKRWFAMTQPSLWGEISDIRSAKNG